MKLKQLIFIPICIVCIAVVYLFANTKFPMGKNEAMKNVSKPQQNTASDTRSTAEGFDHVLSMATSRINMIMQDSVKELSTAAEAAKGETKEKLYKDLGKLWLRTGNIITGAAYFKKAAEVKSNEENWKTSAQMLAFAYSGAADSIAKTFALNSAIESYENVLKIDSNDIDSKVQLALLFIEGKNQIMNGVLMLKEVEKKDPDNELMNVTLGKLAIVSGQFEKAIPRLEKLIANHPENVEAHYHLAEAYRATGKKEAAINTLEKCKKLVSDSKEAVTELNKLINDIKKS